MVLAFPMISLRLTGCLVLILSGCATLPTFRGPPTQLAKTVPAWPDGLIDYRGIIHCHCYLSHDSRGTFEEIGRACERVGIDYLIMTDHITPVSVLNGLRGKSGRTLFLVGAEISKGGASILGLDLNGYVDRKLSTDGVVKAIHKQGGLAFVGHAEAFRDWQVAGFDGIELYNVHANALQHNEAWLALKALLIPPGSLFRSIIDLYPGNFQHWDGTTQQHRWVGIFGNDAHQNIHLFGPRAGTIGTYEQIFKISTTHVIAPRLDRESIMAALTRGHCYGALEIWGDPTGFAFTARSGTSTALMGDEMVFHPNSLFHIQLPVAAEVRIIRNGRQLYQAKQQTLSYQPLWPGVYRVEAWLHGRPWIFSNPIYLNQ